MPKRKISNLANAIFLSIGYFIVTLFTLLATTHPMPETTQPPPVIHWWYSLLYFIFSLVVTWSFYFYFRRKTTKGEFIISLFIGIALVVLGIILWSTTIRY